MTIPDGVTEIGDHAFENCEKLSEVTIPASVTAIGELSFWWCKNLTSVIVPPDSYAAQYCEDTWDLRELYKLSGSK